jgi:epoxyqueuosine reductase
MTRKDWDEITEETFRVVFKDSPLRTKFGGLKRNIDFLNKVFLRFFLKF